jgi:hypothetical protein
MLYLYRLACRPRRAAESCIPGNHRIRPRHRDRPETGPDVERTAIRPFALLSSPPVPGTGLALAALCTAHICRLSAQSCTNEKSPPMLRPRITATNYCYLEEIGFDPQNPAQPAPPCVHPRRLWPEIKPPRLTKTRILRPNRQFVFSAAPQQRSSRAAPPIRVDSCPVLHSAICSPRCANPKPLPLATLLITKAERATYQKLASFRKKKRPLHLGTAPALRSGGLPHTPFPDADTDLIGRFTHA